MRERYYTFKDSTGEVQILTLKDAVNHADSEIRARVKTIVMNSQNKRMKKDGFEPGWQENIQAYAGGRQEYDRLLKEQGLVELGYDYVPQESVGDYNACATPEFVQSCLEAGIELSGNEQEAIKSGEYFKDITLE